jgi:hypothetical protein
MNTSSFKFEEPGRHTTPAFGGGQKNKLRYTVVHVRTTSPAFAADRLEPTLSTGSSVVNVDVSPDYLACADGHTQGLLRRNLSEPGSTRAMPC